MTEIIEVLDLTKSESGKNTHTISCEVTGQSRHYCVCLHHIKQMRDGNLDEMHNDCKRAVGLRTCPARTMREEEVAKGESIYFKLRTDKADPVNLKFNRDADRTGGGYLRGRFKTQPFTEGKPSNPSVKSKQKPVAKPAPKKDKMIQLDHGTLVNAIVKDENKVTQTKPESSLKPLPGESPRDFAIRRKKLVA